MLKDAVKATCGAPEQLKPPSRREMNPQLTVSYNPSLPNTDVH
jgi:hypothetical protein